MRADSLAELFAGAADGLTGLVTDRTLIQRCEQHRVELTASGLEELLVDWLNELVFLFETRRFLLADCVLQVSSDGRLQAALNGESYDPDRHAIETVVKAATHHDLRVEHGPRGWLAEVVIDL